jgi:diguanylate cyclase
MDILVSGLPATVALAAVAVIAYLFGRRTATKLQHEQSDIRREMKKAKAVIRELEQVARRVRRHLATHHTSVVNFKNRVSELSHSAGEDVFRQLCHESEGMLKPTMRLAAQIAHAYDEIRQQTTHLMAFTEIRTDPLTGLGNRRSLDETLKHQFAIRERYDTNFSIAIFDIDRFKSVNDEHGHIQGDRVLQSVAQVIDRCIREVDTVIRYGGEEFVVILPEVDLQDACVFADRLRWAVEHASDVPVTISGGASEAQDGDDPHTVLSRADSALYSAKAAGRNRVFKHTGIYIEPIDIRDATADTGPDGENTDESHPAETGCPTPLILSGNSPPLPMATIDSSPQDVAG